MALLASEGARATNEQLETRVYVRVEGGGGEGGRAIAAVAVLPMESDSNRESALLAESYASSTISPFTWHAAQHASAHIFEPKTRSWVVELY